MKNSHGPLQVFAIVALAAAGTIMVGCGIPSGNVRSIETQDLPESLRGETAAGADAPAPDEDNWTGELFWVLDSFLIPAQVTLAGQPNPTALLEALEVGPPKTFLSLRSAITDTGFIGSTSISDGTIVVNLDSEFSSTLGPEQAIAIGQLVGTFTSLPDVDAVRFSVDGQFIDVPTPDGGLLSRPVTRNDYADILVVSEP
jgi:hypothetical protein